MTTNSKLQTAQVENLRTKWLDAIECVYDEIDQRLMKVDPFTCNRLLSHGDVHLSDLYWTQILESPDVTVPFADLSYDHQREARLLCLVRLWNLVKTMPRRQLARAAWLLPPADHISG